MTGGIKIYFHSDKGKITLAFKKQKSALDKELIDRLPQKNPGEDVHAFDPDAVRAETIEKKNFGITRKNSA